MSKQANPSLYAFDYDNRTMFCKPCLLPSKSLTGNCFVDGTVFGTSELQQKFVQTALMTHLDHKRKDN